MDRGEVVVLDFAKLEKAVERQLSVSVSCSACFRKTAGMGMNMRGLSGERMRKAWVIGKFDNHLLFAALWRIIDQ